MSDKGLRLDAPRARNMLTLCRRALEKLYEDHDSADWQLLYIASHATLRTSVEAFKHDATDETIHPLMQEELVKFGSRMNISGLKREPYIYWNFIRKHTNDIFHQLRFSAVMNQTIVE